MRRHRDLELLLVLPDGSKSLVPAAWTDAEVSGADGAALAATLGSLADLLHACALVADLAHRQSEGPHRESESRGQAAGMSPCKEDSVQPVQLSLIPDPLPTPISDPPPTPTVPMVEQLPADTVGVAMTLLATVIARRPLR